MDNVFSCSFRKSGGFSPDCLPSCRPVIYIFFFMYLIACLKPCSHFPLLIALSFLYLLLDFVTSDCWTWNVRKDTSEFIMRENTFSVEQLLSDFDGVESIHSNLFMTWKLQKEMMQGLVSGFRRLSRFLAWSIPKGWVDLAFCPVYKCIRQ